ncbi:hypothetical protein MKW92_051124 [Papaver armeniacum]|nr:hypothetical protein MKW92_051124 [Papaver armeniacum]
MLAGQEGGAVVRIPKNNHKQVINQLQLITRKLTEFDKKIKELRNGYHDWVSNQSFVVELPVVTTMGIIHGAAYSGCFVGAGGFGVGFTLKLMLTPMWDPDVAVKAVIHGVIGALVGGSAFQLGDRISPPSREYARTRCMLSNLGLRGYEKNFTEGFLTDATIPLLNDRQVVLREVGVPPGPKLLILDHVERC